MYDVKRCIHARECVTDLPDVFDPDKRPWIDSDNTDVNELADVIMECPTGALQFERTATVPKKLSQTGIRSLWYPMDHSISMVTSISRQQTTKHCLRIHGWRFASVGCRRTNHSVTELTRRSDIRTKTEFTPSVANRSGSRNPSRQEVHHRTDHSTLSPQPRWGPTSD